MHEIEHFVPAREASPPIPLQRYLGPLPLDLLSHYLDCYTKPGELVIDPTAQRPSLPLAAARLGRKALACNFNPINALLVQGLLTLPAPEEIDGATMRLADSLKRGVPLRDHINGLYATTCGRCFRTVVAERFLWDGEENRPVEKQYRCPHCAHEGQFGVDDADLQILESIETQGVHFWYLMERLSQPHQAERKLAEELLQLYTPRNLYALTDLSMRIEALFAGSPLHTALELILLSCLDTCSKLADASFPRATALRLQPPSRFVERNVWQAFEEAYRLLRSLAPAPQVTMSSGIDHLVVEEKAQALVLNEPLRRVSAMLPPGSVSLVVGAPQAYYRPFWTLSYLWSGWLWGRHKSSLLKPLLSRKILGWSWYRRTMAAALRTLHRPLKPRGRMVFLFEGVDLTHVANIILAAVSAAFRLDRILYQPQDTSPPRHPMQGVSGAYRLTFSRDDRAPPEAGEPSAESLAAALRQTARGAIMELLRERGQALHLGWLHSAVYERWARHGLLKRVLLLEGEISSADFLHEQLEAALADALETAALALLPEDPDDPEGPQVWWLAGKAYPALPLGDRVEEAVCQALRSEPGLERDQLEDRVYTQFPGPFIPGPGLVEKCLESYGVGTRSSAAWQLRPEDTPAHVNQERAEALEILSGLGRRLAYQVVAREHGGHGFPAHGARLRSGPLFRGLDIAWQDAEGFCHVFAVKQTTRFGDILSGIADGQDQAQGYIVIPNRRVDLLRFRVETELLLRRALTDGKWQFIKLNHLKEFSQRGDLRRQDLAHIVGLEPLIELPEAQLPLFF
jgi:hypothetical protein